MTWTSELTSVGKWRSPRVGLDCLRAQGAWIFLPRWVEFQLSLDGDVWMDGGRGEPSQERNPETGVARTLVQVPPDIGPIRFIKVRGANFGPLPEWHPGAGEAAWLFVDEVVVE